MFLCETCVRLGTGILADLLIDRHGVTFQITETVQVNLGGSAVFMPQDSLDGPDGQVGVVHERGAGMPQSVKPKLPDPRLGAEFFDDLSPVLKWAYLVFPDFRSVNERQKTQGLVASRSLNRRDKISKSRSVSGTFLGVRWPPCCCA